MLDCDPLETNITLLCHIEPVTNTATFYWTQNVSEAGVSGTAILPGYCTSDNYQVDTLNFPGIIYLNFIVSESTLGYYWCENSNAVNVSLTPSTITPVCPPMSSSQKCDEKHVLSDHIGTECAEENSPTVISRPPLPTSCAGTLHSVSVSILIVIDDNYCSKLRGFKARVGLNSKAVSRSQVSLYIYILYIVFIYSLYILLSLYNNRKCNWWVKIAFPSSLDVTWKTKLLIIITNSIQWIHYSIIVVSGDRAHDCSLWTKHDFLLQLLSFLLHQHLLLLLQWLPQLLLQWLQLLLLQLTHLLWSVDLLSLLPVLGHFIQLVFQCVSDWNTSFIVVSLDTTVIL